MKRRRKKHYTIRAALRISTTEGAFATVHMVLTTGAFLTGYALFLGANDFQLAFMTSLPLLAQLFQFPGAYAVERLGHRKLVTGIGAFLSRALWLPMSLIPLWAGHYAIGAFMLLYGVSSILMNIATPAWTAWMSDLVPRELRGRYFGRRNQVVGIITVIGSMAAGVALDRAKMAGHEYGGYVGLQAFAVLAAVAACGLIFRQPEPGFARPPLPVWRTYLLRPLRDGNYRKILFACLYLVFAVGVSAPFFSAHLLKHMAWNFKSIAATAIVSALFSLLLHPYWGRLVDRHGHRPVLILCSLGIAHLPLYYAFCPYDVRWPIYLNAVLAGTFWSGFNLAMFNLSMSASPDLGRPGYMAAFAALNGLVNFGASLLGGWLAHALEGFRGELFGIPIVNYQIMFMASALLRAPGVLMLRRIHEPKAKRTIVLVRQAFIEIDRRIGFGRQVLALPFGRTSRHRRKPVSRPAP